ncbi:SgcJ/EcaC family oxidoreductase [Sodalis ligni]|uniref:YybH family protein n=1 Tax=Sodalis ligni TaxID=2697027 RepID=UPI00193FC387|nr:SgcJ/EcaC family oxidoreductase [Sodalis ligni]QWA10747.1 SgcJ/EcaC family oxidoreductase [Sodalis ligni]
MGPIFTKPALLPAVVALAFASAAVYAADPPHSTVAAIKAENARWADAFKQGDYQAIGRLYTDDGTLLQPGDDRVVGPAAIAKYFTAGYAGKAPDTVTFSDAEFYGNDEAVTEVSNSTIRGHDGKLKSRGKQALIFLKQGGVWKLHRDIWNDNGPLKPGDR